MPVCGKNTPIHKRGSYSHIMRNMERRSRPQVSGIGSLPTVRSKSRHSLEALGLRHEDQNVTASLPSKVVKLVRRSLVFSEILLFSPTEIRVMDRRRYVPSPEGLEGR